MGLLSSLTGSSDFGKAAEAGAKAVEEAKKYGAKSVNAQQDFVDFGKAAMSHIQGILDDPSSTKNTPGYSFLFNEGMRAVRQSMGAAGKMLSAQNVRGATRYGQNFAMSQWQQLMQPYWKQLQVGSHAADVQSQAYLGTAQTITAGRGIEARGYLAKGQAKARLFSQMMQMGASAASGGMAPAAGSLMGGGGLSFSDILKTDGMGGMT